MRKHALTITVLLLCLFGATCAFGSQQEERTGTVEIIGRGRIYQNNVAKARNAAIADALHNAVEQQVGRMVPKASVVDRFQLLSDEVYSKVDEVILDYKVLTESKSGTYYRLMVQVTLFMEALEDKLEGMGILTTKKSMPSILLLLWEKNIGQFSPRYSWGQSPLSRLPSAIEKTLSRYMEEKGFFIINRSTVLTQAGNLGSELSDETAVKMASLTNAEVVIVGKGVARLTGNVSGTGMKSVEASLSLRAMRTDNSTVIASFQGTSAAVHEDETIAGTRALTLAATNASEELSEQIISSWAQEASEPMLVEMIVKGIQGYADFVTFRTTLRNDIRGVRNVYLKAIKQREAKMAIDIKGTARMLADELMLQRFEGFGLNIIEVDQSKILLEIMPKQDLLQGWQKPKEDGDSHPRNRPYTYPAY